MEWLDRLVEKHWCFFCVMTDFMVLFLLLTFFSLLGITFSDNWGVAAGLFAILAAAALYAWISIDRKMIFGLGAVVGSAGFIYVTVENLASGWAKLAFYAVFFLLFRLAQHYGWTSLNKI